tara:strand:- start:439 stop:1464 length:1026 start_codon:yes stop_codon:yes gene_type:complete
MSFQDLQFNNTSKLVGGIAIGLISISLVIYLIVMGWSVECLDNNKLITIEKGSSAHSVAKLLKQEACLNSEGVFKFALMITMNSKNIRSGRYNLKGISTIGELLTVLTSQSKDRVLVTLVEGWNLEQYADALQKKLEINTSKFLKLCKDYSLINSLGIEAPSLEGFLFPDTYIFLKTYTEEDIIRLLVNQFKFNIQKIISNSKVKLNLREITTMASIIQGEAIYVDEMPIVSSVYHNRLKRKMLLQADPTIQYIVPGKPRRLFNKDLRIDNPYNTYMYKGLPPGPINNPGLSALKAAVEPAKTDYLYFVANMEGRHTFTYTPKEHNRAKQIMKQKRKKQQK